MYIYEIKVFLFCLLLLLIIRLILIYGSIKQHQLKKNREVSSNVYDI